MWNRARLYLLGAPAGGGLAVQLDDVQVRNISTQRPEPSLVEVSLSFPEGSHRLTVRPIGDGEVRLFGVSLEREGQGVIVDSIGIRGRQARSWLAWDEAHLLAGLGRLQSDVVVLAYGTNEAADEGQSMAQVEADLELVIARVKRGLPEAACIVVGPTDRGVVVQAGKRYQVWGRTALVAEAQRKVALRNGCVFWDWQAVMGGPGGMLDWFAAAPPLGAPDLIHLSQAGYQRSADLFLSALDQLMVEPLSPP
jgi:lysophospholipase L1-like esterase